VFPFNRRPLRSIQIEVTTRCSLRCLACPRAHLAGWRHGDLSDEAWQRLEPDLRLAQDVHLQGWGEPLLDPLLAHRARAARAAGCRVGLTTNGVALANAAGWLAALPVDRVVVSIGAALTPGAAALDDDQHAAAWSGLAALARARHGKRPRLLVSILLTRASVPLLPAIVQKAADANADEVFLVHLDCTPAGALLAEAVFSGEKLRSGVEASIVAASARARRLGLPFRPAASRSDDLLVCALDPRRFAFVSWDGRVGPCVNLRLPLGGSIPRVDEVGRCHVEAVSWGRLPGDSLAEILRSPARQEFIAPFEDRVMAERTFRVSARAEWGVEALAELETADREREAAFAASPFPSACRGCHKARGW
jgi:MoaA/NifB/PqqE/SkfB family radical SAM enzyme